MLPIHFDELDWFLHKNSYVNILKVYSQTIVVFFTTFFFLSIFMKHDMVLIIILLHFESKIFTVTITLANELCTAL